MNIRETAVEIYRKALEGKGADADIAANAAAQERAFIKRLVLTALRRQEFLKKIIGKFSSKPLPAKLSAVHLLIILGAVEILYFDTPEYAIVNSYVELAKKNGGKYAGGFVNAILHKICQNKENISQAAGAPFFPKAFRRLLQDDYSQKQINAVERTALNEPPLDITVKKDASEWSKQLDGKIMPNGSVRLYSAGDVKLLSGYNEGAWWVQDMASSLAVISLGDIKGKNILDLCAAPGGKTAQLANGGACVTALDISAERLNTLKNNLDRLQLPVQEIICEDALNFLKNTDKVYDIILVDAPCSATGTLRRHPEIIHTRGAKDIEQNAALQKKLLEAAASRIINGGIILYAVCSLSKKEGEKQILEFVSSHPEFKINPIKAETIAGQRKNEINELITNEGFIRCLPCYFEQDGGLDGFFVAQLKKVK